MLFHPTRRPRFTRRWSWLTIPIPLLLLALMTGCAVLLPDSDPDPDPPTRGKLSDAADQASVDPEKQKAAKDRAGKTKTESKKRKQEEEDDDDQWVFTPSFDDEDDDPSVLSTVGNTPPSSSDNIETARFLGGPVGGVGFEAGRVFKRIDITGIKVGAFLEFDEEVDQSSGTVSVSGLIMRPRLRSGHPLYTSIEDDVVELAAEFALRGYATPVHTFLGAYGLIGYRVGWMQWDWRSPVFVPNGSGGTDEIRGDSIVTHVIFAGLGFAPAQWKHVHVGVNFAYGLKFYSGTTGESFENDLFRSVGTGRLLVEAVYVM